MLLQGAGRMTEECEGGGGGARWGVYTGAAHSDTLPPLFARTGCGDAEGGVVCD